MSEATLMRGLEERVTESARGRLRYFVGGSGPTLILVHGLGGSATNWSELAARLSRRYRVLVPDLPGHGRSAPAPALSDLAALVDPVREAAAREGMLPAAFVGHSMGGVVALRAAVRYPSEVRALVLAATAGIGSATRRAAIWLAVMGVLRPSRVAARFRHQAMRNAALRRVFFSYWGAHDPAALSPEATLGFLEGPAHASDVDSSGRALTRDDPRLDLARVSCPCLLVWGACDRLVPLEEGFEYARRLRAPIRAVAGAGHLLIGERPDEFAALVDEFLEGVRDGGTGHGRPLHGEAATLFRFGV
jgi:pimeloyl-ACP methyl ester carboxylesterase